VVYAMPQKGEHIGSMSHTLGLAESKTHNISNAIHTANVPVERGTEYLIELTVKSGTKQSSGPFCEFTANVVKSQDRFTIPKKVIEENNELVPGRTVKIDFYQLEQSDEMELKDDNSVIDRVEVRSDKTNPDGVDSQLHSERVHEWIGDEYKWVKFRNTRTKKESMEKVTTNKTRNRFSFPINVRRDIDAKEGDLVEVIEVVTQSDKDVEELIREMHGVMMELYNTHLEQNDD